MKEDAASKINNHRHGNSRKSRDENKHTNQNASRENTVTDNKTRKNHRETYRYVGDEEIINIEHEGEKKDTNKNANRENKDMDNTTRKKQQGHIETYRHVGDEEIIIIEEYDGENNHTNQNANRENTVTDNTTWKKQRETYRHLGDEEVINIEEHGGEKKDASIEVNRENTETGNMTKKHQQEKHRETCKHTRNEETVDIEEYEEENNHKNQNASRESTETKNKRKKQEHRETNKHSENEEPSDIEHEGERAEGRESKGEELVVARCSSEGESRSLQTCHCCHHKTSTLVRMSSCPSCMPQLPVCPRTGFTRENLEWLEQMFRQALGHKQELSFDDFKKIVHSRNSFFAERVFQIFDRDNSGTVSLSEFLDAMHQFAGKSPNDKIKFLFRVYDLDGDGLIQQSELQKVMKACMEENGMRFSDEQIQDLTLAMFEDADTQNTGAITYESLKAQLEKHDGLIENLSISIDRWLVPPNLRKEEDTLWKKVTKLVPYQMSLPYLKNNYVYLSFLLAYIAINVGLFFSRGMEHYYLGSNGLTIAARACGQCLNFNCMFVCVLVLRQCITYLRSMGGASFLPLDQHLYLHKLCGILIFIYSVVHTIAHLINFAVNIVPATGDGEVNEEEWTYTEWILTMRPGLFGLVDGIANPTGVALMVILTVMVVCSLPFVRKSGYFEVFYWTHLLYIAFWTLCILHGPHFWKWFVVPGVVFLIERFHRSVKMRMGGGKTYISSGVLLPSKVIHLVIRRPAQFHFHPGDYVFINIPVIANYEWHPFTISSAPEQEDVLWLHIRAVGQWTRRLYDYFEREQQRCESSNIPNRPLPAALTLPDGTKAVATVIGDGRSGCFLSAPTNPNAQLTAADPHHARGIGGENGVANLAYEHDGSSGKASEGEGVTDAPVAATRRKRRVNKSTSEGNADTKKEEDAEHRAASRSSSEGGAVDEAQRQSLGSNALYLRSRSSQATSFKYMRRKPRVITVDLPSDSDSWDVGGEDSEEREGEEEEEEEEQQQGKVGKDLRLTIKEDSVSVVKSQDLAVVEEGRMRRKSQEERRRSRQEERKMRKLSRLEEAMAEGGCVVRKPLVVYMDGPFGAPSSHIFRAQHAVLIATGIGVTPFASILQSIMHKYWKVRHSCPRCAHTWTSDLPQSVMNLRKVDFFWINRDQRSFEWFVNLLSQLEIEQAEQGGVLDRFLDMHMYITSALQKTDMKAVGLQLALDLLHEKEKRDLITGLKTRTNAGRPNWDKVFMQLAKQQKGKITVFYCGPPALGRTLRYKCDEYGFDFRKEIF